MGALLCTLTTTEPRKEHEVPTFYVHHTGYVTHVETVEADSPEGAIEAAEGAIVSLCHECSHEWSAAGDPEISVVTDQTGETAWEAQPDREQTCGKTGPHGTCVFAPSHQSICRNSNGLGIS